jgi:hypothetical protein
MVGMGSKVDTENETKPPKLIPTSSAAARDTMDRAIARAEQVERERLALLAKPRGNC